MIGEHIVPRLAIRLQTRPLLLAIGIVAVLLLALVNLDAYPATWFDEGQYLHVPKALLQHGVYADWSSDGPRYYGPTTAAGPTVLLPIAGSFAIFGTGLVQARLVITVYLLLCLALCYMVAARIATPRMALLATALLLASRGAATLPWGRQVLGEVPALAFVLAGLFFWHGALIRHCGRRALAAGVCWGLAMVTKNQAIVAFAPAVALLSLLEWRVYRNGRPSLSLLPPIVAAIISGGWLVVMFTLLGPGDVAENLALTRKATSGAILVLTPEAAGRAIRFLMSPQLYGGLLLPALLYGGWRVWRKRDPRAQTEANVLLIVTIWLLWYVCSLGWPRYAYIGAALGALPVARLLADAWAWARRRGRRWMARGIALVAAALIVVPLAQTSYQIVNPDRSVLRFAAFLDQTITHDTIIATWEPELGGLTDHRYNYPPQALLDVAVRHQWSGGPPARYDLNVQRPPYVVIGPFGAWTEVYPAEQIERDYREMHRDGSYVLYGRKP
jgi:4-amino-4-deoxy-L-arabinose transferase-like glycosyltransferase